MANTVDRQAREHYFNSNPAVKNDDSIYRHWSIHAPFPDATWTSKPIDPQVKTAAPIGRWDHAQRLPDHLLNPSSPAPIAHDLSHSLQQGYISVNTDFGQYRETEASPSAFSPPSNQFYSSGQYGGSTPSLVSPSLSTPPTGKSALLTLTPDQGMQAGHRNLSSPDSWENLSLQSPGLSYVGTGATPDMTGLHINSYDDVSFQMARPAKSFGQQSSVLLGSIPSFESSQASDTLDPLELDFPDLSEQASVGSIGDVTDDSGNYSINIVSSDNATQSIPISVNLEGAWPDPSLLLSPLSNFQALPVEYRPDEAGSFQDHLGVAFQRISWGDLSGFTPTVSPASTSLQARDDKRPSPLSPAIKPPHTPGSPYSTCTDRIPRVPDCGDGVNKSPRSVLEAVRTGHSTPIINPKGVSDRTLAAAEANRKRVAKFQCHICGNSQTSKQNLENHILSRHMQLKRFLCPIEGCSAKYGHARGVNRHLDTKHPGHRQTSPKGKRGPPKRV